MAKAWEGGYELFVIESKNPGEAHFSPTSDEDSVCESREEAEKQLSQILAYKHRDTEAEYRVARYVSQESY